MSRWLRKLLRRKDRLAALETKIDGLECDIRTLLGTVEELKHLIGEHRNG